MHTPTWLDHQEYPFQSHFLDLPMGKLHYLDEGTGRPIVMVHGTPTWSFLYRHLIKALSPRYRCVAPDHIGFGLSDKPTGWSYRPQAHAQNLKTLIETLGLHDITLVVEDFGGPIGLAYAVEKPDNVKHLIIMNTWMWSLRGDRHYELGSKILSSPIGRLLYKYFNFSPRVMLPLAMGDKSKLPKRIHQQYLQALPTPKDRRGTMVFAKELIASSDWYDGLWQQREQIKDKPVLIVWGMQDRAFREKELKRWVEVFTTKRVIKLENVGHFVAEEQGRALAPIIEDFLSHYG